MKFGTMENVLGIERSGVFAAAAHLGFEGVEIDWNELAHAAEGGPLGPENRNGVRLAAQDAGMEIPSVCAHFLNGGGLAHAEPDKQERGLDAIRVGIAVAGDLGASVLLIPFFGAGAVADDGAAHDRLAGHLRTLAPIAEGRGVILAVESTLPALEVVRLIDGIGSQSIRCYWDMANAMGLGYDPVEEVRLLGWRIAQVHAKEFAPDSDVAGSRKAPRFDGLNRQPLGQGRVPVRDVLAELHKMGFNGYLVLETGAFGDRQVSARAALDYLRACL